MGRLIPTPTSAGLVGNFEPKVLNFLRSCLPDDYAIAANVQLKPSNGDALEYDFIVLAPHAVYVVEAKEWYGRLTGDDSEWLLNQKPRRCPLWLVNHKSKVLKSELGALGRAVYVSPVLVIPDGTVNHLGGNWGGHVRSLTGLCSYLQEPQHLQRTSDAGVNQAHIEQILQGKWGARQQLKPTRFGSYEVVETLYSDERSAEYLGRRWLFEGAPNRYRIRTWRLDPGLTGEARDRQLAVIRRPTEAVSKIGPHPNLLQVLQFEFIEEDNLFFEVTDWSELGTLHGFLNNKDRDRLTLRERLEIADGVANALTAVHEADVVHRNVSPRTILLGFDRRPRLTDFDRAFIDSRFTVFPGTTSSRTDPAYIAPELEDATDYDFNAAADMYSFGVLLYKLLTDQVPFEGASEAKAKRGRPAALPSEIAHGVSADLDALILSLLRVDDYKQRPAAAVVGNLLRSTLGRTTGSTDATPSPTPSPKPSDKLEVGSLLKGTMRVDAVLGAGGLGKVFKVFHLDHQRHYALKVLFDNTNAELLLREFNQIKPLLPSQHRNIAEIVWMDRLDPPERLPYLLTELIDGETLEKYCDGTKPLSWTEIHGIGGELMDALIAIHPDETEYQRLRGEAQGKDLEYEEYERLQYAQERAQHGIFHRDIKPANIMLAMPDHRAVLIDFNISSLAAEDDSSSRTPKYCPADWLSCSRASYDLFSLGLVLYELVVHRHPYKNDNPTAGEPYHPSEITTFRPADALSGFLSKCVQPSAEDRFASAREMKVAWDALSAMYAPTEDSHSPDVTYPGIALEVNERGRADYNPYVSRLLTLYSQARRSNAGTRGLDDIARLTYVQTRLDERLAPAIVSGNYRLVLISGNAGDGKTAFLQQVQSLFAQNGASVEELPSQNGARWTFNGMSYESNYDGSQDEGDRENDEVLERFFEPFAGSNLPASGTEARLIAINEGRLIDFLQHSESASRFAGLKRFVLDALDGREQPTRTLLVNLNVRAVTAHGDESLLEKQLQRFLNPELWAPCRQCSLKERCPIKHNVDSLGDPSGGPAVRRRIRRLFEVVHLRRRMHVTMRDLRSALSYLLLRDTSCAEVAELLSKEGDTVTELLQALYYPNAFAGDHLADGFSDDETGGDRAVDRLVRRLREVDVGVVSDPALDRRLDHRPATAVPWMTFDSRAPHANYVLQALQRDVPQVGDGPDLSAAIRKRRRLLASWRRWAFFERRDEGWQDMLPYTSLGLLERVAASTESDEGKAAAELRDAVINAISLSEGVRSPEVHSKYLALRISRVRGATTRSYRLFPKSGFDVRVVAPATVGEYLEYSPDAVELVARGDQSHASLRISLDLLEMLMLIASGYRPTTTDLQGLFVNLLIFRNELLTSSFSEVLVTADDHDFYKLSAQGSKEGIALQLGRIDELSSTARGTR